MPRLPRGRWGRLASRITNEFELVLLLVLAVYVLASVVPYRASRPMLVATVLSIIAIVALLAASARPALVRWAAALSVVAVTLAALSGITGSDLLRGLAALVVVVLLIVATATLLRAVLRPREVGFRTILGAISVYIMLGLLFAFLYFGLDQVQSEPFFSHGADANPGNVLFFSVTTLTGTGYGDLVPAGQPGKMFAGLEMLTGQMFLVTLIAGLVSLWRPRASATGQARRSQGPAKHPS